MSEFELAQNISSSQVRATKFKQLSEDDLLQQQLQQHHRQPKQLPANENKKKKKNNKKMLNIAGEDLKNLDANNNIKKRKLVSENFSLEYSYPAVIFERVCFSVDKSQQQSNLLNEILYKLSNCIKLSSCSQQNDSTKNKVEILKSVNLHVPYGSIFGLLGPSSCGKTTLLRCLVGLLNPSSGAIRLFGHSSDVSDNIDDGNCCVGLLKCRSGGCCCCDNNSRKASFKNLRSKCKVPGSNVGYMPQDLGLYEDFSICQLLRMFGRYMGMDSDLIEKRIKFMTSFLDLPDVDREISSLSGGQKRRVSFAVACLHMPPLIILDEPTVGVDPLLRQSIWKYLRRLADEENKTIIITTHYIEEAAQADQVAFMRAGEILVQDSPRKIMQLNGSKTLEEAFLKICNNVETKTEQKHQHLKLYPQPAFNWHDKLEKPNELEEKLKIDNTKIYSSKPNIDYKDKHDKKRINDEVVKELKQRAQEKLALFDLLYSEKDAQKKQQRGNDERQMNPTSIIKQNNSLKVINQSANNNTLNGENITNDGLINNNDVRSILGNKLTRINNINKGKEEVFISEEQLIYKSKSDINLISSMKYCKKEKYLSDDSWTKTLNHNYERFQKFSKLLYALVYKNFKRNLNSVPLVAFQFLLPVIQMISFSLCVGGKPSNIGLGLVNNDQLPPLEKFSTTINTNQLLNAINATTFGLNNTLASNNTFDSGGGGGGNNNSTSTNYDGYSEELLSDTFLSFIDSSMILVKNYKNLNEALADVRRSKLWAAMEIGENFTETILKRFDFDNFYQLDASTIQQSVIKLYPDRSNKVLDMICQRSLVDSFRQFLLSQFSDFTSLPIQVKEPIFDIKPNLISNSIDGYTESIAAGLLASLTYIMAAGLTTFIMVVERSTGLLERTYTSGINPVTYLLAHAIFRTLVMMLQIALIMILTFYVLRQPLVGSIWLAYTILMVLNLTGISYGLLISSIVKDQNGAALTIVSSLVVKITMSGILWPFEAIPRWLRAICYIQPLTMPIAALKAITLKGSTMEDKTVYMGFIVSTVWLVLFLTVAAKRFKFYQH